MSQPPGSEVSTSPTVAKSAPSINIDERISLQSSSFTRDVRACPRTIMRLPSRAMSAPKAASIFDIASMSVM